MIRRDIVANFLGRSWSILMGIAFVPVYLATLGTEAYGLIGFYATLQAVLIIADLGLSWTITRELSQARTTGADAQRVANLLRTMETVYWLIAILVGVSVSIAISASTETWFRSSTLAAHEIRQVLQLMGAVLALQMPSLFYQGALNGFDRQPTTNLVASFSATLRWAGAALVIWLVSPTIQAFFVWQVIAAAVGTAIAARAAWRNVPNAQPRFDPRIIQRVWRFAFGVMASALAGVLAMQLDKLVLSRLIPLEQFGHYSLAVLLASLLPALATPLHTAFFPRFAQFHARDDVHSTCRLYHTGSQLLSVLIVPVALVLAVFPHEVLFIWTGSEVVAWQAGRLLSLLAIGNLLYSLAGTSNQLLIAAGWPVLSALVLTVLAAAILPALFVFVPRFGAVAAATIWVMATAAYLLAVVPVTHRRLLGGSLLQWGAWSVLVPIAIASSIFAAARWFIPVDSAISTKIALIGFAWTFATLCIAVVLPETRQRLSSMPIRWSGT